MTDKSLDNAVADADVAPSAVAEEAAEWAVRWHTGHMSASERRAFLEWLRESRVHIAEYLRVLRLISWSGRKLAVQAVALQTERDELKIVWAVVSAASDRDLILWAEDAVPVAPRIKQASGVVTTLPETTLKLIASDERQRRSKRRERVWWGVGVVTSGVVSSVGTWLVGC